MCTSFQEAEDELGVSRLLQVPMSSPPYHRSLLHSKTYDTLACVFSHLPATQNLQIPDNGDGRMEQEKQQQEPECSEFACSDFKFPSDVVLEKEVQEVHETIEGVEDKGRELSATKMVTNDIEDFMGIDEVEVTSKTHAEATSVQADGFNKEQALMDELELFVKGTDDHICNNGFPLEIGLDEKQNGRSEVDLMDFEVEHFDFLHADVNKSGNTSKLQVQGELNQLASEGFHPSSTVNVSTSVKGQTSALAITTLNTKHEIQQKEMVLVKLVCTEMSSPTKESELKKEGQGPGVVEAVHLSSDLDVNMYEDGGLLGSAVLIAKQEIHNEEKLEDLTCLNTVLNSSNNPFEKEDREDGEISGGLGMDGKLFDLSSRNSLILHQKSTDDVSKLKNAVENIIFPCKIGNGEKGHESNSFIVNALQDGHNSGQVEPRTSDGTAYGVEIATTREVIKYDDMVWECDATSHGNSSELKTVNVSSRKKRIPGSEGEKAKEKKVDVGSSQKHGPCSETKKAKKKLQKRKKRAEANKKLGVNRLKLPPPVEKPKAICRHYVKGRCQQGDKCHFSHDIEPETKSKPCIHFARHSCMKGDDCPFDHQLSKYSCFNFKSGSCRRGDACMFSHQEPTIQDILTPSNVSKPELKCPLEQGNTNFSEPHNNHGYNLVQQNHLSHSAGIHSQINIEHVTNTQQKHPMAPPKGVSFINISKSSFLSPSTPKQGTATPNKESLVRIRPCAAQNVSGTNQTLVETPKKLPSKTPKGINFLSFRNRSVCNSERSISFLLNKEHAMKLPHSFGSGMPEQASPSLTKGHYSKVSDGTKQSIPQTDQFSDEMLAKNQSVAEGMKVNFLGNSSINDATTDLQCCSYSRGNQSHSKFVHQGKKPSNNSQISMVTSPMLLVSPLVSNQSSECLSSYSSQRALLSTLAFAEEHESDIKMKYPSPAV